jgi:hypothetical protein
MRAEGFDTVDLKVSKLGDDDMLRIMIQENAGQNRDNAASVVDSVAAVLKELTYKMLTDCLPDLGRQSAGKRTQEYAGIGAPTVRAYFDENAKGQLTKHEIESTLATLKQSDQYPELMTEVIERVKTEFGKKSPEWVRAQKLATSLVEEDEPEEQEDEAADDAEPNAPKRKKAKRKKKVFNAKCANVFKRTDHLETFRDVVTDPDMLKVLPVDSQYDLAKAIVAKYEGKELTSKAIRAFVNTELDRFLGLLAKRDKDAEAKALAANIGLQLKAAKQDVLKGFKIASQGIDDYIKALKKMPKGTAGADAKFVISLRTFITKFASLETAVADYTGDND